MTDGLPLMPHPDFPSSAVSAITVDAGRQEGGLLALRFFLEGKLDDVIWPGSDKTAGRADKLWLHSCFEAFVGFVDEPGYCEFNFASSGKWAAYAFDGYRDGMRDVLDAYSYGQWDVPVSKTEMFVRLPCLAAPREWRLGLSAIIEGNDGSKSYWALKHPAGKPDFHHADCFAARIAPPPSA